VARVLTGRNEEKIAVTVLRTIAVKKKIQIKRNERTDKSAVV